MSQAPVNFGNCGLRIGKRLCDRGFDAGVRWFDRGREDLRDIAVAPDQVLMEVPLWHIPWSRVGGPPVEGVRSGTDHDGLGRDREGNGILVLRGLRDLLRAAGLLAAEIVGGNADDRESAAVKLSPQFLQSRILRGVAALRCRVDDNKGMTGVFGK